MAMNKENVLETVETLKSLLADQIKEVADTKMLINKLLQKIGFDPIYTDVLPELGNRADQYYGKPLGTAAREYLERRRQASSAEEILKALEQGGYDTSQHGWKEKDKLRSFSITLAKNSKTFHRLPNGTFGLLNWYDAATLKKAEPTEDKGTDKPKTEEEEKKESTA